MKLRRMLSILLAVLLIASCAAVVGTAVASGASADLATTAATSAYQDMLAKTSAENHYGLMSTVNNSTILQAWNWSFKNIEANLETVAEQGFTTIQVSPPNEIKEGTVNATVLQSNNKNGWWMYYQPAGFQINNSTDNALGTKAEFVSMCDKAHQLGLKIIVDAVINHMGTNGNEDYSIPDPIKHVTPRAQQFEPEIYNNNLFHTPYEPMEYIESGNDQYKSTYDLTRKCTSNLPDLRTEDSRVQKAIYDYMDELLTAGADGFRFDAAKHIETPDDMSELRSDFWKNTLTKARNAHPEKEGYAYGEILNSCGVNRPYSMYFKFMQVTDNVAHRDQIMPVVRNGSGDPFKFYNDTGNGSFSKANTVLWAESHDTYIDGTTTSLTVEQRNKIWACVAGRADITGVYLARPDDSTSKNPLYSIKLGEARKTSWSNNVTKAINQFHNYYAGKGEYCSVSGNKAYIERGNNGIIIVTTGSAKGGSVSLTTHILQAGNYKDAISGNVFKLSGNRISGTVGTSGVACLYLDDTSTSTDSTTVTTGPEPTTPIDSDVVPTSDGYYSVVFSNSKHWGGTIQYYCWNDAEQPMVDWPGTAALPYDTNEWGEDRYLAFIPVEYPNVIFNDGSSQTADYHITGHIGLYPTDDQNPQGHYKVGEYEINTTVPTPPAPDTSATETQAASSTETQAPDTGSTESQAPDTGSTEGTVPPDTATHGQDEGSYYVGDADMNKIVEILDCTAIQRHLANLDLITDPIKLKAADADEDKVITITDVTFIQRYLAKLDLDKGYNVGKLKNG